MNFCKISHQDGVYGRYTITKMSHRVKWTIWLQIWLKELCKDSKDSEKQDLAIGECTIPAPHSSIR